MMVLVLILNVIKVVLKECLSKNQTERVFLVTILVTNVQEQQDLIVLNVKMSYIFTKIQEVGNVQRLVLHIIIKIMLCNNANFA